MMTTPALPRSRTLEKPIIFSGSMVCAILEGRKTQTRRIINGVSKGTSRFSPSINGEHWIEHWPVDATILGGGKGEIQGAAIRCPHPIGTRMWVREKWRPWTDGMCTRIEYAADSALSVDITERMCHSVAICKGDPVCGIYWRPSIHLPRWASRITLEVTGARVERVQNISEEDAEAEGVPSWKEGSALPTRREAFAELWDSINSTGSWAANPWVWVYTLRRIKP